MNKRYFEWLCNRVDLDLRNWSRLASALYSTPFEWSGSIPTDRNRASDGIVLRYTYEKDTGRKAQDYESECTVLEMLVALSERMDDILGEPGEPDYAKWFWIMISNLHLDEQSDGAFSREDTKDILQYWMGRRIDYRGQGGLFPLRHPYEDQRELSIWDQMSNYVEEKGL